VEKLDILEAKVDRIQETISEINVTMAINTKSLQDHMERTALNEEALKVLKEELKPVHEHVLKVNYTVTVIGVVGAIIGFCYTVYQIVQTFKS